jgi:hypothetical protein
LANENADVAYNGSITHDTLLIQDGISFYHGDAAVRKSTRNPFRGCHARHFYRCSNHHGGAVRAILGDEKNACGKEGKDRKNAYVHALTTSL